MQAVQIAITFFGSQAAMAAALGVKQPTVSEWLTGERPVPDTQCVELERLMEGRLHVEALRGDVKWRRVADAGWPWHPDGKPLVDVSKDLPVQQRARAERAAARGGDRPDNHRERKS